MKLIARLFLASILFTACGNNAENNEQGATDVPGAKEEGTKTECYLYTLNKDTISLQVTINNQSVAGQLVYNLFEKDMSSGIIQGEFRGDTLLADYEFKSEGIVSVREVAFIKKGDGLAEGYGEGEEKDGKMMFKNVAGLNYSDKIILKKVNCGK